jgi:hypothetical protein
MTIHIALLGFAIHVNERRPYSEFAFLAAIHHRSLFFFYILGFQIQTLALISRAMRSGGAGAQGRRARSARARDFMAGGKY